MNSLAFRPGIKVDPPLWVVVFAHTTSAEAKGRFSGRRRYRARRARITDIIVIVVAVRGRRRGLTVFALGMPETRDADRASASPRRTAEGLPAPSRGPTK
jgi:hypothetical protein